MIALVAINPSNSNRKGYLMIALVLLVPALGLQVSTASVAIAVYTGLDKCDIDVKTYPVLDLQLSCKSNKTKDP